MNKEATIFSLCTKMLHSYCMSKKKMDIFKTASIPLTEVLEYNMEGEKHSVLE